MVEPVTATVVITGLAAMGWFSMLGGLAVYLYNDYQDRFGDDDDD